jgi:hypothetical protein
VIGTEWCWYDRRRAVHVSVTKDVGHYRELLARNLGPGRAVVTKARFTRQELEELQEHISSELDQLSDLGIQALSLAADQDGVSRKRPQIGTLHKQHCSHATARG